MNFKVEPHSFGKRKSIPWMVCKHCGLIRLRNPITEWCVKQGCGYDEHPGFEAERQKVSAVSTTHSAIRSTK